jgi:hypothetical protein
MLNERAAIPPMQEVSDDPATTLLADALASQLMQTFDRTFGSTTPYHGDLLGEAARLVIERIALSDALYHTAEAHGARDPGRPGTILRGCRLSRHIRPDLWMHVTLAALTHDIGYVRGICQGDTANRCVIDEHGRTIELPRGASDAFLAPYHVERSKIFVKERFVSPCARRLPNVWPRNIELTRFPVPNDDDQWRPIRKRPWCVPPS